MTVEEAELDAMALRAADAWIGWWTDELARDGRGMAGGWPGTLSEARERAVEQARSELGSELSPDELEALARATYVAARTRWRSKAARDDEP